MSQQLINHSPDLKRLQDEGYEIEVNGGYLLVHHIPYLNNKVEIKFGTLVSILTLSNNTTTAKPDNHVVFFAGENPCNNDGTIISAIQHSNQSKNLGGITVNHSFSNKPVGGYANYFDKISTYATIISAPAKSVDDSLTEKTYKVIPSRNDESVFQYIDTNSSRANINLINAKFENHKVAIIGLGGTGAYILDLVSKTPVKEIHLFDGDFFLQHNAFRSPGAATTAQLDKKMMKAEYFAEAYSGMHKKITPHNYYVNEGNANELDSMSFVFICVDRNSIRKILMECLLKRGIPFIDVGLGVNLVDDKLIGSVRVTSATPSKNDHLDLRISGEDNDHNEYTTNIQIADLNSLNAAMAVIKWKKMVGFYQDLELEHHSSYSINVSKIFNEDSTT
jgi:hypothetical protein